MLLKVVMSLEPATAFVEQYVRFVKRVIVLSCLSFDMKGVKKSDQGSFHGSVQRTNTDMEVSEPNNPGLLA